MRATEALQIISKKCGDFRTQTGNGWVKFRRCFRKVHRTPWGFGVNLQSGVWNCYSCGKAGPLKDLGVEGTVKGLAPSACLAPRRTLSPAQRTDLPWRPFTLEGPMPVPSAAAAALDYLASRGITRDRAVRLGLGYGIDAKWSGCTIHPWYDGTGALAGWQGRRINYDPETDRSKVLTTTRNKTWPNGKVSGDGDFIMAPQEGALIGWESMAEGRPVVIVEGPYDQHSVVRVLPCVATLGHELHEAQRRRILIRKPSEIILGWDSGTERDMLKACREWYPRLNIPLKYLDWQGYKGDWAADEDKEPQTRTNVEHFLAHRAVRFSPGM